LQKGAMGDGGGGGQGGTGQRKITLTQPTGEREVPRLKKTWEWGRLNEVPRQIEGSVQ